MIFKTKTTQKFIFSLMLIIVLTPFFFSIPKQAEAQFVVSDPLNTGVNIANGITNATGVVANVTNAALHLKDIAAAIGKQLLMALAKRSLAEITKSTVNWINTGFHGQPLFLENPGSFFNDIRKSEVKRFIDAIGYDTLKFPFGRQIALQTIQSYKTQFEINSQYSLSKVVNDPALLNNYRNNFNFSGWNGLLVNTQYQQNNPIGFQILASEELGKNISGTINTKANQVKDVLQQGMGFLSPQTCPSNPNYPTAINPYNPPTFNNADYAKTHPLNPPPYDDGESAEFNQQAYDNYSRQWTAARDAAKAQFNAKNTCPGGLVNTTPGAVVSNQITNALNIPANSTLQAAGLGNSLTAVFDALINHFMSEGLNSLASTINPEPQNDSWTYNGSTLGSSSTNTNGNVDVFNGPDEVIVLSTFKQDVADGIRDTQAEINLMDSPDPAKPGIAQIIKLIPTQTQVLDQCLPGPDKSWEDRLKEEQDRVSRKLLQETSSEDQLKVKAATAAVREVKFAAAVFKDWLTTKMIGSLSGAVLYMDAVKEIDNLSQQTQELTDLKRVKSQTLARLKALQLSLATLTDPDSAGLTAAQKTAAENNLVTIRKQYNAIKNNISTATTISETQSELDTLKDKSINLTSLTTQCGDERVALGWERAGGKDTKQNGNLTEEAKFCSIPLVSGYSHGEVIREDDSNRGYSYTFRNPRNNKGDPGYEDLPILNADNVYGDDTRNFDPVDIDVDCNTLFKSSQVDYTHAGDPTF